MATAQISISLSQFYLHCSNDRRKAAIIFWVLSVFDEAVNISDKRATEADTKLYRKANPVAFMCRASKSNGNSHRQTTYLSPPARIVCCFHIV
jgi:hypothetical protein